MDKILFEKFNYILSYLPPRIQMYLKKINIDIVSNIQEIRMRSNRPIVIVTNTGCHFLNISGKLCYILSSICVVSSDNEIQECINKMCGYSMHNHYEDILNGYITLPNGSRVGLTGTAIFDRNDVKGLKDIDGINIRIPRQIKGVSEPLFNNIFENGPSGLVIVGPPSSGKTTMLKDIIYQFSSGRLGRYYKICVVDERKEIITSKRDVSTIGPNTDVLYGFPKSRGISMAVRTLSPDIIICDEVDTDEIDTIIDSLNTGVFFVLSIHARNFQEFQRKNFYKKIIENKCFQYFVFLKGPEEPCSISQIINIDGEINEICIDSFNSNNEFCDSFKLY